VTAMRICAIVKYPPIQGGVSARSYWIARSLAELGHHVHVVTNADEVEDEYRIWIPQEDHRLLECSFPDGGQVLVTPTWSHPSQSALQVPRSDLYLTRLASLAADVIRQDRSDLVFSYYLEPYSMAGHLAASWTNTPHVIQHAGSDRTALLSNPELSTAYREILISAAAVISKPGQIENLGVATHRVHQTVSGFLPSCWLENDAGITINEIISRLGESHPFISNTTPVPADRPTVLVYGKLGAVKGTYDLIQALALLRNEGKSFNFVIVGGGEERKQIMSEVRASGLDSATWTLPFVPHWRMPQVLRQATIVCCLEQKFPIAIHSPGVVREVLAAGRCLVISQELLGKQSFRDDLVTEDNVVVIDDPQNIRQLATAISPLLDDQAITDRIGEAGRKIPLVVSERELGSSYASIFEHVLRKRRSSGARRVKISSRALFDQLRTAMPGTTAALRDAMTASTVEITPGADVFQLAQNLYTWIGNDLQAFDSSLYQIAGFELDTLWTRSYLDYEPQPPGIPLRTSRSMRLSSERNLRNCIPVPSRLMRVRRYRPDIVGVIESTCRGDESLQPLTETVPFIFLKRGDMFGKVLRVTDEVLSLLALCDGQRSAIEVLEASAGGDANRWKSSAAALRRLVNEGVIRL
jgi:glycosyltransferase involved in cell wall biosynthesis